MWKIFLSLFLLKAIHAFDPVTFTGCGVSKSCLIPNGCTADNCVYGATWFKVGDYLEIELVGDVQSQGGYMAIGFSRDNKMGEDTVIGCFSDGSGFQIQPAYNTPDKTNQMITSFASDYIQDQNTDSKLGGQINSNNRISCRFRRKLSTSTNQIVDLTAGSYYMLLARGSSVTRSSNFNIHFSGGTVVSSQAINFNLDSVTQTTVDTSKRSLAKAHGCLMVLAWVMLSSIGIIMARYYKELWPNRGLLNQRIWFQVHRTTQTLCLIFVVVGFILIFIGVGGYSYGLSSPLCAHPVLGIIVFILTLLNPIIALLRCHPDDANRPWFNWIHFFVGTIAYVLAVPTMMLGLRMPSAGDQLANIDYPLVILIIFVFFQVAVEIILEIHGCMYYKRNKGKQMNYELQMEDFKLRENMMPQARPLPPQPSGRLFKYFMAGLHATIATVAAFIIVIAIILN